MNTKTLITLIIVLTALGTTAVVSYLGTGLPTQKDPISIRQLSAQNQRDTRGGGTSFGK